MSRRDENIRVAVAGIGNCTSALVEGICFYRQHPETEEGLLFRALCGYSVRDINVVAGFDVSALKVGRTIEKAIYQPPNNFVRIENLRVEAPASVYRGPTLDGNPEHLASFVPESSLRPVDVVSVLMDHRVDVLVNLIPTGSIEATEFYAQAALKAGCAFVNCIPTPLAQREDFQKAFEIAHLPLFGDDIKSQLGTTILHRALLALLELRGSGLRKTSQINIGGNMDFANFVHRSATKITSKRKSLHRYVKDAESHVGHHYDPTSGPWKTAHIEIESKVFGGSTVDITVHLKSDDKPNCAGSVVDLIRLARGALDRGVAGCVPEACAFYMKSPPIEMDDHEAYDMVRARWANVIQVEPLYAREMATHLA